MKVLAWLIWLSAIVWISADPVMPAKLLAFGVMFAAAIVIGLISKSHARSDGATPVGAIYEQPFGPHADQTGRTAP